ncbi:hypothetical protein MKW98_006088 [Papaver atlanticum]|uniref:Uncharacterized protein n=1 Tax=Papaver atlanticum TaxID=357466 RepID=A0AAD4TGL8_9MAGN|nr:hypothetical protein MKW98_006088 [Papaver atlanticum]
MKAKLYHLMKQRAVTCRHFVVPLWKGTGYVTMFVQVQMPHIIFTGLEDYKARGTQAAPYFTATYFTEFAETKDMVLVRGDIVFTSKLTDTEAQWLLETTQAFYLNDVREDQVKQRCIPDKVKRSLMTEKEKEGLREKRRNAYLRRKVGCGGDEKNVVNEAELVPVNHIKVPQEKQTILQVLCLSETVKNGYCEMKATALEPSFGDNTVLLKMQRQDVEPKA